MRRMVGSWVVFAASVFVAVSWVIGASLWIAPTWPLRSAMAKVEQAREESRCAYRPGDQDIQDRCRDTVQLIYSGENATAYFEDGLIVFGPALLALVGGFVWLRRGRMQRRRHDRQHHSAA